MAGRKVFTSGEILTAADVNSFLMDQSVMVFADSSARSSAIPSPTEGMVTYREDANRVEVYDGSAFGPIGGILQVVQTVKTNAFSASIAPGATALVTGLDATITPSTNTSKVLVILSIALGGAEDGSDSGVTIRRDGSPVYIGDVAGSRRRESGASGPSQQTAHSHTIVFLDSPATTSSVSYDCLLSQTQISTQTTFVNRGRTDADSNRAKRVASSYTLMEVAV